LCELTQRIQRPSAFSALSHRSQRHRRSRDKHEDNRQRDDEFNDREAPGRQARSNRTRGTLPNQHWLTPALRLPASCCNQSALTVVIVTAISIRACLYIMLAHSHGHHQPPPKTRTSLNSSMTFGPGASSFSGSIGCFSVPGPSMHEK